MSIDHTRLGQLVDSMYAASTLDERFQTYQGYIHSIGFSGATYTFVPNVPLYLATSFPPVFLYTEGYPTAFLEQYAAERLDLHDFTIRRAKQAADLPRVLDWRTHELLGLVSEQEAAVIALAREAYGIRNAITIPTMCRQTGLGGVSLISNEDDRRFASLKQDQLDTLVRCTQAFHDINFSNASLSRAFVEPLLKTLRPKEIAILRHLANGQHLKTIERSEGISYNYASNVVDKLRKRMGGITKERLMYLVGLLDIMDHT